MKKTWELKIVEEGKVTYSQVSDEWDIVEGSLIFLQQDRDKKGYFIIEELFDGKRIEVLLVNGDEHIPVDDATVFHLFLRAEYKMKQKAVDEGAEVNEIDREPFIELAKPIQDKTAEEIGATELLEKIRDLK